MIEIKTVMIGHHSWRWGSV